MDLIPQLNTAPIVLEDKAKTSSSDDNLGSMLQGKWEAWSQARREIEEDWLKDLRAFNQQPEEDTASLSKFHSHIYIGLTRTKVMSAYARITDLMFQSRDKHWRIEPTPVPKFHGGDVTDELSPQARDLKNRAELMNQQMDDQLIDLGYEDIVKAHVLEATILGTGCIKGVIPGVKTEEKWQQVAVDESPDSLEMTWDVVKTEIPAPQLSSPSIFDIYPDPFATKVDDMSGLFERHTLNRAQFSELKDDARFDEVKINEILTNTQTGNHVSLYHETERKSIGKLNSNVGSSSERYDVLEYWGQASGQLLQSAGVDDVDVSETYWANVWVCSGKTLFAKIMPMKKQRIPYSFFQYNKVPHQFWGVGPARMMRYTQAMVNGSVRALLDAMVMMMPQAEVNVHMLKAGQDPSKLIPGMVWLRDKGDPSIPAVRYFQPSMPTGQLMQLAEMAKVFIEDETALPAYTYGDNSAANDTAKGLSMQMSAASLPIKSVIKNLEDGSIKPVIESLFNWNMEWSDREDIKGDMQANILATSSLMAKEVKSQQLLQFLNITSNPQDMQYVDRKYLLTQLAKSVEIDTQLAIPDEMPQQLSNEPPAPTPLDQAKTAAQQARAEKEMASIALVKAQTTKTENEAVGVNLDSEFKAIQAALQALLNRAALPVSDQLLLSAGFKDADGTPTATLPEQNIPIVDNGIPENTSPSFPPHAPEPHMQQPNQFEQPEEMKPQSAMQGIEAMPQFEQSDHMKMNEGI